MQAKAEATQQAEAGIDIVALELAARFAIANGVFEDAEEELPSIVEEFYPEATDLQKEQVTGGRTGNLGETSVSIVPPTLCVRLGEIANRQGLN